MSQRWIVLSWWGTHHHFCLNEYKYKKFLYTYNCLLISFSVPCYISPEHTFKKFQIFLLAAEFEVSNFHFHTRPSKDSVRFKPTLNLCNQLIIIWTVHHWKQINPQIVQNIYPDGEKFLFSGCNNCILFFTLWVMYCYIYIVI